MAYHYQAFTQEACVAFCAAAPGSFDIAHLHACRNLPGSIAARELSRAGVPYVLSPNGTARLIERRILLKRLFDAAGGRRVIDGAGRVLATSEAECRQFIETGIARDRVTIIRTRSTSKSSGIFRLAKRSAGSTDWGKAQSCCFSERSAPRKGVDVLLHAFGLVTSASAQLVIAGNDMGSSAALESLTGRTGLGSRVTRVGLLRGQERVEALVSADVVVYPLARRSVRSRAPRSAPVWNACRRLERQRLR